MCEQNQSDDDGGTILEPIGQLGAGAFPAQAAAAFRQKGWLALAKQAGNPGQPRF